MARGVIFFSLRATAGFRKNVLKVFGDFSFFFSYSDMLAPGNCICLPVFLPFCVLFCVFRILGCRRENSGVARSGNQRS